MFFYKKYLNYKLFNGNGKTLVFIHGLMESIKIWKIITYNLCNNYRILLIDLPGHGRSKNFYKINTMERIAKMIKNILKKEKIKKAFFIGHSMGGYVILSLAEKYPDLFLGICFINSTPEGDSIKRIENRIKSINLARKNYSLFVSSNIRNFFNPNKIFFLKKNFLFFKKIALSTSVEGVISCIKGIILRKEKFVFLKNFFIPKLFIFGDFDLLLNNNLLYNKLKKFNYTYVIKIKTGHMSHLENPKIILHILKFFIKNNNIY